MKFKKFLVQEKIVNSTNKVEQIKDVEKVLSMLGSLNSEVIWRGFTNFRSPISLIINDRPAQTAFRGGLLKGAVTGIIKKLGIKQVAFGSFDKNKTKFFGTPMIMVPIKPFIAFQSKEVSDLADIDSEIMTKLGLRTVSGSVTATMPIETPEQQKAFEVELDRIVKTYKKTIKPLSKDRGEILFDIKKYYLVNVNNILGSTKFSKFSKIKTFDQIKTFVDVSQLLRDWLSWEKFKLKRR